MAVPRGLDGGGQSVQSTEKANHFPGFSIRQHFLAPSSHARIPDTVSHNPKHLPTSVAAPLRARAVSAAHDDPRIRLMRSPPFLFPLPQRRRFVHPLGLGGGSTHAPKQPWRAATSARPRAERIALVTRRRHSYRVGPTTHLTSKVGPRYHLRDGIGSQLPG
jgi:hypothetical protein